jgi:hypothetical protein
MSPASYPDSYTLVLRSLGPYWAYLGDAGGSLRALITSAKSLLPYKATFVLGSGDQDVAMWRSTSQLAPER